MIGNLTRDPELKNVGSSNVCKFSMAMNHRSKDNPETCFLDVVAWGKQAEFVAKYFTKGKPILVEGRLKQESWEKDGKQVSKHVLLAEKISFIGSSQQDVPSESAPMFNEEKRIMPINRAQIERAFPSSPQKTIDGNLLDNEELPF